MNDTKYSITETSGSFSAPSPNVRLISLAFESSELVKTKWLGSTAQSRAPTGHDPALITKHTAQSWMGIKHFLSFGAQNKQRVGKNPMYYRGRFTEKLTVGHKGSAWETRRWRQMASIFEKNHYCRCWGDTWGDAVLNASFISNVLKWFLSPHSAVLKGLKSLFLLLWGKSKHTWM